MCDTILIPTDGSEGVEPAVDAGLDLARTYEASVHSLSAVDPQGGGTDEQRERREEDSKAVATDASEAGLEAVATVRTGRPGKRSATSRRSIEGVCLATGGSSSSAAATDHALAVADACDATLHALYAVEPQVDPEGEPLQDALQEHGEQTTSAVATRAEVRGIDAISVVETGHPTDVVLEYADRDDVDLVVMGTESKSDVERLVVGSVSQRVVPNATVPVMTARTLE
ncbi:universal stress protein [Natronolimnohabitans innermongolicus]|uniref:UspA domain-containing protein n=1 Tax=Natronolimnohabitans innermongolicus JCM 12255 TaxID=1227499 RepID=L9WRS3_9EURY|nr:universal stress protein [Natronolimnohabitans innermongolicus]ELY50988.1 UspA domain-containing protein [Natronolimnohabitans innermongolicus JCM 12255]